MQVQSLANGVGPSNTASVKSAGRLIGAAALILFGLNTLIALEPAALAQAPATGSSTQPSGIAGGATGSGASGISGGNRRFSGPVDPIAAAKTAEIKEGSRQGHPGHGCTAAQPFAERLADVASHL